jgi:hypothetical protein
MRKATRITVAALLTMGLVGAVLAQAPAPAPAGEDHGAHHPEGTQPLPPPAPVPQRQGPGTGMGMGGPGGTAGGDMGRMMQMMMQERRASAATQPFRRIEGQLAYFRAELRITEAQTPQWNAFADAVRAQSQQLAAATQVAMAGGSGPAPAPEQMQRQVAFLTAQLEAMRAVSAAAGPLYAVLSVEQRRTADELMAEHFRAMRIGVM